MRVGYWRIGALKLWGSQAWAEEVAHILKGDLTPA